SCCVASMRRHTSSMRVWGSHMYLHALSPPVLVSMGAQVTAAPIGVLITPLLFEPGQCRRRQSRRVFAQQGGQRLLEIAGRDALEIQPGQQLLDRAGAPQIRR